jgi:type VI secretion system secreted protein Hcp
MSEHGSKPATGAEPAIPTGLGITANRRDVLKTATGLMAAAAVGGVFLMSAEEAAAQDGDEALDDELTAEPLAETLPPDRTMVNIDEFSGGFQVDSLQYGVANAVSIGGGGGHTAGKANFSEIVVTKLIDRFSAALQLSVAQGKHYAEVNINLYRNNYIAGKITLEDVIISGYSFSHGGGNPSNVTESVSFNYAKITFTYAKGTYSWDLESATT